MPFRSRRSRIISRPFIPTNPQSIETSILAQLLARLHLTVRLRQCKFGLRIQLSTEVLSLRSIRIRLAVGITACPLICSQCMSNQDVLLKLAPSLAGTRMHAGTPAEDCRSFWSARRSSVDLERSTHSHAVLSRTLGDPP